jgi:heme iron utilization protein
MALDRAEASLAARRLLRASRAATLATQADGQPFASLVTPATAPELAILMLLSGLSEHTRHLRSEPRCAVMALGPAMDANPQTAPRVTVTGIAELTDDPTLKARWLAVHPYAALYAGFADFSLWCLRPLGALYVGGFGRAARLSVADLTPDPEAVDAIAGSAERIIAHCNTDHAQDMARLAGEPGGTWRMVAVDIDGCDLASDDRTRRIDWAAPVRDASDVRAELIRQLANSGA